MYSNQGKKIEDIIKGLEDAPDDALDQNHFDLKKCNEEQRIKIRKSLMTFLSRREHSCKELFQKMQVKGFDTALINTNIDDFTKRDWQSDKRYTAMLIRSRVLKSHGPVKITMELKNKGISSELIESFLNHDSDETYNWNNLALSALRKKFPSVASDQKGKAKQFRFLQYRGFSGEQVSWAIKNFK